MGAAPRPSPISNPPAERRLDAFAGGEQRGVETETSVVRGQSIGLKGYVEDSGVDAVVVGTHGRYGVFLGPVTERVVRTVDVPVVTVTESGDPSG